jgi:hypothetical protein
MVGIKITRKKENWRHERYSAYFVLPNQDLNSFKEFIGAENLRENMKTKINWRSFLPIPQYFTQDTFTPAYEVNFNKGNFLQKLRGFNPDVVVISNGETLELTEIDKFIVTALAVGGHGVLTSDEITVNSGKHYVVENIYSAENLKGLRVKEK